MPLIIENGSIVANANSYVTDAEYTEYATSRGDTVGETLQSREAQLLNAMDFLESCRDKFKGTKVSGEQPLQWPRFDVWIDSYQTDSNSIPIELKRAQMELAILINNGVEITPSATNQNIQSESIGDLSVSYFSGGTYKTVQMKSVDQFLDALMQGSGKIRSIRI